MKKVIKLTETQLNDFVKKVINEQMDYKSLRPCKPGDKGTLVKQGNIFALSSGSPFCKVVSGPLPSKTGQTGPRPSGPSPSKTGLRPSGQSPSKTGQTN
jgi:hypothetical protein